MRILHIFTNPHLTNGATVFEHRVSQYLKSDDIYFDYLVTEQPDPGELERYHAEGSRLYQLPLDKAHGLLIRELKVNYQYYQFFKNHDYDIVYADTENGLRAIHLLMARLAGVSVRVVHSHNTSLQTQSKLSRWLSRCLRVFFYWSATDFFACSDGAARWLFPAGICEKGQYRTLKNGVDLEKFSFNPQKRQRIRDQLRLGDAPVLGNVGRFMPQKNHLFLLEIFHAYLKLRPEAKLMLIGTGPLEDQIKAKLQTLGMEDSVILVGNTPNVCDYLQAMDVFVMPSLFEGLPITGIEAQAAGLPCLFSDTITQELAITELANYSALALEPEQWAQRIDGLYSAGRKDVCQQIIDAGYSITDTVDRLREFYIQANQRKK